MSSWAFQHLGARSWQEAPSSSAPLWLLQLGGHSAPYRAARVQGHEGPCSTPFPRSLSSPSCGHPQRHGVGGATTLPGLRFSCSLILATYAVAQLTDAFPKRSWGSHFMSTVLTSFATASPRHPLGLQGPGSGTHPAQPDSSRASSARHCFVRPSVLPLGPSWPPKLMESSQNPQGSSECLLTIYPDLKPSTYFIN